MNDVYVSVTKPNTVSYPMHCHNNWEVMYYLNGEGYMKTEKKDIPFKTGSVIVVPPKVVHGSVSINGFTNISVGCDFESLLIFKEPVYFEDDYIENGKFLAQLLFKNRYGDRKFLSSLCDSLAQFILMNTEYNSQLKNAVTKIIEEISINFCKTDFKLNDLINSVGYCEDYIRAEFKNQTQVTPVEFLTKLRIDHAKKLLEIYSESISIQTVADMSGFSDPVYFSKRFKQYVGIYPNEYKKQFNKTRLP